MLKKLNTILRLLIVGLLIYPMPIVSATEVTVNEGFEDSTYQAGLTISGGSIYCGEQGEYGTTGCSLYINSSTTFTFSSDINVYEIGFIVGAVNNSYSVRYYYSDGTDETLNMSGQSISNITTMYDNFYKSFTDYNNNEANTDKYITKFDVNVSDASLVDTLYWQYDDADATGSFATTTTTTTTTIPRTIGTPTNASVQFDTVNNQDGFLVSWSAPTDGGYSPERYAVFFGEGECCQYAVATGNVGDNTALNTYYFFSMDYLTNVFGSQYGDFYWKVRSDNDTEALYSGWSETVHMNSTAPTTTTTSTTQPPVLGAPINVTSSQTYGTGVLIDWDATDSGNQVAESWEVYYYQVDNQQNAQIICTVLVTECTIPYSSLPDDTYKFYIVGYDNENSIYSSASATTELQVSNTPPTPNDASSVSVNYSGEDVMFSWEYTDGNVDAHSFHINYSYDNTTWKRIIITDTSLRKYDLDKELTETGTFYWIFSVCGDLDNGESCTDSDSNNFETTEYVPPTTTTLPPPPPPPPPAPTTTLPPVEVVVMDDGTEAEYTTDQIAQGDVERDNERKANEDKWGCYVTNIALERGDCEAYNTALYNSTTTTTTTTIPEIKEEIVIKEEILDDVILDDKIIEEEKNTDEEFIDETEISISEDEIIPIVEEIPIVKDVVTDGDLVEDVIKEPLKEETLEDTLIVEETIIDVMEIIEISKDNFDGEEEEQPVLVVKNLSKEQKEVVKKVAVKVTKTEDVQNMSEEERIVASAALGVAEEELEIVAELAEKDESVSQAVEEFIERASAVPEGNEYTLADAITEVQVEAFLANPLKELTDINLEEFTENLTNLSEIGNDMTEDQREKAQEVVVPVILASQIIAQAGAMLRRF